MLQITNINTHYNGIHVLRDLSLTVDPGEIVTLVGANGAGKTTLLLSISGIVKPSKGKIHFMGQDLTLMAPDEIVKVGIVHVPEGRGIFQRLNVEENLEIGAYLVKDRNTLKEKIEKVYSYFPILSDRRKQSAGTLSGGEAQMLAIGRGLMTDPKLLLLDEPSSGLAPMIVKQIFEMIQKINSNGVSILLVEENAKKTLQIARRAYVLEVGKIVKQGSSSELIGDPSIQKAFLGIS